MKISVHFLILLKIIFYFKCTHLFFLLLFSYVLLFKFSPPSDRTPSIDGAEIATIILVICMFVEEIRYVDISYVQIQLIEFCFYFCVDS